MPCSEAFLPLSQGQCGYNSSPHEGVTSFRFFCKHSRSPRFHGKRKRPRLQRFRTRRPAEPTPDPRCSAARTEAIYWRPPWLLLQNPLLLDGEEEEESRMKGGRRVERGGRKGRLEEEMPVEEEKKKKHPWWHFRQEEGEMVKDLRTWWAERVS